MRPIDADVLEKKIRKMAGQPGYGGYYVGFDNVFSVVQNLIADMPTISAVPVVRCRECVYYQKGSCNLHSVCPDEYSTGYDCRPDDDDFCSYGQRKEEEHETN